MTSPTRQQIEKRIEELEASASSSDELAFPAEIDGIPLRIDD